MTAVALIVADLNLIGFPRGEISADKGIGLGVAVEGDIPRTGQLVGAGYLGEIRGSDDWPVVMATDTGEFTVDNL